MKRTILSAFALLVAAVVAEAAPKQLPDWQEGYLDIHHISTGRGSAIFFILPDGTRLLSDAGDLGNPERLSNPNIMPIVPNASKRPAEWVAHYIERFSKPLGREPYLDYAIITHFDSDHYGKADETAVTVEGKPYKYSGITHLANLVPIGTLIDRGYPDYDYPTHEKFLQRNGDNFLNYHKLIKEREGAGLKNEQFKVGSDKQLVLRSKPEKYPTFRIQNIAGNGKVWTGEGDKVCSAIPSDAPAHAALNENSSSCVMRLEYGDFAYYLGGDISGFWSKRYQDYWNDVQSVVSRVVGKVDVAVADHHGYRDSMNETLLKALDAEVVILPIWDIYHPHPNAMKRIIDHGITEVFPAGMTKARLEELRSKGLAGPIRQDGHIVVRVYKGGKRYQIFVLNDCSTDYEVLYKSKVFKK